MHSLLRKVFGTMTSKITVDWRRLHSEEIQDVILTKYRPGDQIKNNEVGMPRMGERRDARENRGKYGTLIDQIIHGRILKCSLNKSIGQWTALFWLCTGTIGGLL
jgi:hypothetical protein